MSPLFRDLKKYCENNGWTLVRKTDHYFFEKMLADGTLLRTKVSHSLGKEIPRHLWERIVKHQLKTTEKDFWEKL